MGIGKQIRMQRLFAHPSGRFCSVAVDHLISYGPGMPEGLRRVGHTLQEVVAARPDAVTMHKGIVTSLWGPYAGVVPLILQTALAKVDGEPTGMLANAEDAVRLGADAVATARFLRGHTEIERLVTVADLVRQAAAYDMPVIFHVYPRKLDGEPRVSFDPDDLAWAVRCAVEVGADVVKAPYCGDPLAQAQIVADCPVPLVAAGGPQTRTLEAALQMMGDAVKAGMRGATIGRNIWGVAAIKAATLAFKAVIHDGASPQEAMRQAGL